MSDRAGRARRLAVLAIPAGLVVLGWFARGAAGLAFKAFTLYPTPYSTIGPAPQAPGPPLTPRVVLVLLDGVGLVPSRSMPYLNELRGRGASFDCGIGQPSLSLPGRAVLMSGAWQEVNGQTTNYFPRAVEVEHLFALAAAAGRPTALAAGSKVQTLFAPHVAGKAVYAEDREEAPFAHYEDRLRADLAASEGLLKQTPAGLVFLELTLADEGGHGWGTASSQYTRALALVDDGVRRLATHLDLARDTLVVTADHGHVAAGGHGGPEPDVMSVPLVMAGRGVRAGPTGAARQVDVASTLAVLLGLPQPAASQGRPLLEALEVSEPDRVRALGNAVLQRRQFVKDYARILQELPLAETGGGSSLRVQFGSLKAAPAVTALPQGDEATLSAELGSLRAEEARVKAARRAREAQLRSRRAIIVAAFPLALLVGLGALGAFTWQEAGKAAVFAAAALVVYYALLPALGLHYSLTAVNKDEWLQSFFMKDMVLAVACTAVAAGALCAWRRRQGAALFELCRLAWLCGAIFCTVLVLKVAVIYTRHDVFPRWALPDQFWGMGFYLDTLALMAVGLCGPALALPALLALAIPSRARA